MPDLHVPELPAEGGERLTRLEYKQDFREKVRSDEARGYAFHRVRVVEEPLTPYMQWELHWLHLTAECGERVRVLPAGRVAAVEAAGPLPELTLIGGRTLYRVVYTDAGATEGAVRHTDPSVVQPWVDYVRNLFTTAEDIASYFPRAVAPLPPPPAA